MSDLLNNATSGLLAFRRAIATTSHNIANSRTEGYSRQRVELQARSPSRHSDGTSGNGVQVTGIERLHDGFAAARVLEGTSAHAREDTHHALAARIDNLVADDALGLAPALSSFYSAIEDAAADPGSSAAREVVLAEADALAGRFGTLQAQLDDTRDEVTERLRADVDAVNDLAAGVADLNRRIVSTHGRGRAEEAGDLLDQRDRLVEQLATHVDVSPIAGSDGSVDLVVGGGTSLVLGTRARTLVATSDPAAPGLLRLELEGRDGHRQALGATALGGSIGGLSDFAAETLDPVRHRLGRLALVTAAELNAQHGAGVDANGEAGVEWFSSAVPDATPGRANTGGATLDVRVDDASELAASAYVLRWDGAAFEATRQSDGTRTGGATPLVLDGLEIAMSGTPAVGDTFVVSATGHAAGGLQARIDDPRALAFARPVVASAGPDNRGEATLAQPRVDDPDDPALRSAVDIVFTADDTYDVLDRASGTPLASGVAYTSGQDVAVNGWSARLDGTPRAGDTHRVDPNADGGGDNGNALALVAVQEANAVGGVATMTGEHADLVAFVGGRTRSLATRAGALESLRDDAIGRAESVSGVNLDEEAIALTRYEQAYQASAQAISVADTLFQSILGVVAR